MIKKKLVIGAVLASLLILSSGAITTIGSADELKDVSLRQAVESTNGKVPADKVLITYSTVGDSRIDDTVKGLSDQDYKWMVNTKVMSRMMKEIEAQHSKMFFFNGDMIMGYTPNSDVNVLNRQYVYWRNPKNYPQIGMDNISTDQSKLSYSYDYRGSHFVVINTDPTGYDGHAPSNWLADDLAKAKKRGVSHNFVFGHKPAYTYYFDKTEAIAGLDNDMKAADAFWKVIQDNKATYFAGHEHIFNVMQPNNGKAYQVMVGSGGSPFEATKLTTVASDRMYAWVTVKVYASGKVHMDAYGFDDQFGETKVIKSWDLEKGF